ncbi:hypothetical protein FIA58_005755 [Flavobacterium jejuense]|uniref:TIR domain-containing protein n=1 Tax=Flavobacterium jejuense TaxID=1544455 RepID=A0ABX0ITL2_9FLAO|nr:hypothetical protein [Flavobacterium jejuense]NHN25179.1 hypothetical protein [Flavobacterium jejuense]
MKVFLSYSLNDQDLFILTLLAEELNKKGFIINQSNDFHTEMSSLTRVNINNSNLFIGLISGTGHEKNRVINEWRLATSKNIPCIFLIENTVPINQNFKSKYLIFDRYNPHQAIEELKKTINIKKENQNDSNALAWILGGAALLSIISLLSKDDKK